MITSWGLNLHRERREGRCRDSGCEFPGRLRTVAYGYREDMGVLFLPASLVAAWLLSVTGVPAPGSDPETDFASNAIRWMMSVPVGGMFIASGLMHTVFAKRTAESIGWKSNGFQYEIGFVSFGIGAAGINAAYLDRSAWVALTIVVSVFLLGAAANHIYETVRNHNVEPGNTVVLAYDVGLPLSLWALVILI